MIIHLYSNQYSFPLQNSYLATYDLELLSIPCNPQPSSLWNFYGSFKWEKWKDNVWDSEDAKGRLFGGSFTWLKAEPSKSDIAINSLSEGVSQPTRRSTTNAGMRNWAEKHYHKLSYLPFVFPKSLLFYHGSSFSSFSFFYELFYKPNLKCFSEPLHPNAPVWMYK